LQHALSVLAAWTNGGSSLWSSTPARRLATAHEAHRCPSGLTALAEHLREAARAELGEHLREEHLACMAACSARIPRAPPAAPLARAQEPTSTSCLASTRRPAAGKHELPCEHLGREIFFKRRGRERADGTVASGKPQPSVRTQDVLPGALPTL